MISATPTDCETVSMTEKMNDNQDIPQSMDVILGRGKSYTKHPGNMFFQGK
jgi:hypothetical protein